IAEPGAAPFLFDGNAQKSQCPQLRPQIAREAIGAVDLGGTRRDLVLREIAHRVAQHFEVAAKTEIKSRQAVRQHRWLHAAPRRGSNRSSTLKIKRGPVSTKPARTAPFVPGSSQFLRFINTYGCVSAGLFT